ncbi:MAG: CAP domain-containing protein [Planctomycetota bacterium]|jgi:hypothetical protein
MRRALLHQLARLAALTALSVHGGASAARAPAAASSEDKPLRVTARTGDIKAFYMSQLLGEIDRPLGERIELPGKSIPVNVDKKGKLKLDLKGDGRFWKTIPSAGGALPVEVRREGIKRPLRMKLHFKRGRDGTWTYRNATQLTLYVGKEELAVVDANSNGVFNEPGVDGITWAGFSYVFPLPTRAERWCTRGMELTGLEFGPWGEDAKVTGRALSTRTPAALPVLGGVNEERVKLGLTPRPENAKLSAELQRHCAYMAKNGKLQHHEEKGKPGYSPEGHKAGMRSILGMGTAAGRVADMMVRTYFHRQDVIRPHARGFGVGYEGRYSGIDGRSDLDKSYKVTWPILCPAPDQDGITLRYCKEAPDATPGDGSAGYPITAYFATRKLKLTKYSLKPVQVTRRGSVAGAEIDCYEFDPAKGASAGMTGYQRCVCIIPKDPLQGGTLYEVTLEVDVDGTPWTKTWRFSTGRGSSRGRRGRR